MFVFGIYKEEKWKRKETWMELKQKPEKVGTEKPCVDILKGQNPQSKQKDVPYTFNLL